MIIKEQLKDKKEEEFHLAVSFCSLCHVPGEWGLLYTKTLPTGSSGLYADAFPLSEVILQFTPLLLQKEKFLPSVPLICKASSAVRTVPQKWKLFILSMT